jgi:endonuclease YncB( thermonuclease family)
VRTAYKVWSGIAAGVFCLVAGVDLSHQQAPAPTSTPVASSAARSSAPTPTTTAPATTEAVAPEPGEPAGAGQTVTVSRVIDGDTFVAGGQKIRVLGIDSCEAGTDGGSEATAAAKGLLEGQQVVLRAQPGVDRDRYGRELRYVQTSGGDYGDYMVGFDHTGVYQGRNDASPAYVAKLRSDDTTGRTCSTPAVATDSSGSSSDHHGSINWPSPGDQGLPDGALTGGYCARKWWC